MWKSSGSVLRVRKRTSTVVILFFLACWIGSTSNSARPRALEYAKPNASIIDAARKLLANDRRFIYISFINEAYVDLTKSWLCNLRFLGGPVLKNLLVIVDSVKTKDEFTIDFPEVEVQVYGVNLPEAVSYGYVSYYYITALRLHVQDTLIQAGVSVFVVESDATWLSSTVDDTLNKYFNKYDIVSQPNFNGQLYTTLDPEICAGFSGYLAKKEVRKMFANYVALYKEQLDQVQDTQKIYVGDAGEQVLLSRILESSKHVVGWLNFCDFATGIWYTDSTYRNNCEPKVIQNNFIVGVASKEHRAKEFGHWFLKDGHCELPSNSSI